MGLVNASSDALAAKKDRARLAALKADRVSWESQFWDIVLSAPDKKRID